MSFRSSKPQSRRGTVFSVPLAKKYIARIRGEVRFYQNLLQHPRTPRIAKWLLAFAVGYLLMPFDIIPDFIPILGQLDDLLIIPLVLFTAVKFIPKDVIAECRAGNVL